MITVIIYTVFCVAVGFSLGFPFGSWVAQGKNTYMANEKK